MISMDLVGLGKYPIAELRNRRRQIKFSLLHNDLSNNALLVHKGASISGSATQSYSTRGQGWSCEGPLRGVTPLGLSVILMYTLYTGQAAVTNAHIN